MLSLPVSNFHRLPNHEVIVNNIFLHVRSTASNSPCMRAQKPCIQHCGNVLCGTLFFFYSRNTTLVHCVIGYKLLWMNFMLLVITSSHSLTMVSNRVAQDGMSSMRAMDSPHDHTDVCASPVFWNESL